MTSFCDRRSNLLPLLSPPPHSFTHGQASYTIIHMLRFFCWCEEEEKQEEH